MDDKNLVFLSYSSPDREAVLTYYEHLTRAGFNVWMDKHRLKGGQNWDFEIKRGLQKATIIVVFLSHNSVDRRGYAQREIKIALDQAHDRLVDDIYVIPVILDRDVPIPEQLNRIQAIGLDESDPREAVSEAITHQLEKLGVETAKVQAAANIRWTMSTYRDSWEGIPGYDVSYQLPHFTSSDFPHVGEITDIVRGCLQRQAMSHREVKFDQMPDMFNFGEDGYQRQNSWEASCGEPLIKERVVSLVYAVWWFGAKTMHPNHGFETFVFTLNPVTEITALSGAFSDEEAAFALVQAECRERLLSAKFEGMTSDDSVLNLDQEYVEGGTKSWEDFGNFAFNQDGIDILFDNYSVAPYAFGPQFVQIPYSKIAPLMRKEIACMLGIEHLREPYVPYGSGGELTTKGEPPEPESPQDPANDQDAA